MLATSQKLHASLPTPEQIAVLVVSSSKDDYLSVCRILKHGHWRIERASNCSEARERLRQNSYAVVLCERDLPDGSWRQLLAESSASANAPAMLVISRFADESLWSDVLNLGGYDVLPKPFDSGEVTRVIGMAWRHSIQAWMRERTTSAAAFA